MDRSEDYPEELLKPLLTSINLLKTSNVYLLEANGSFFKSWSTFFMIVVSILQYIGFSVYIVTFCKEGGNILETADMIPIWIVCTEGIINFNLLSNRAQKIKEVIDYVASIYRTEGLNTSQMKTKIDAKKKLYYADYAFVKLGRFMTYQYTMIPLCITVVNKLILNKDMEMQLPFSSYYPFEINNWFIYLVMYAFQCYTLFRAAYIYLGVGWLLVVLISHINVLFLLLQEDILHIKSVKRHNRTSDCHTNTDNLDEITEYSERPQMRLEDFVKCHQNAILATDKLNSCYSTLIFVKLIGSTLLICFFAVAVKASTGTAYAINNYGAIIVILSNIFIVCHCSQVLSTSSSGIALAAAKTKWYEETLRHQTSLRLIMTRSQKPCSLNSVASSPIGLDTFNKVLKTTWSYFSLASQLYDERD